MNKRHASRRHYLTGIALLAGSVLFVASFALLPASVAGAAITPGVLEEMPSPVQGEGMWYTIATFEGEGSKATARFTAGSRNWRIIWSTQAEAADLSIFNFFVYQSKPFNCRVSTMMDEDMYPDNTLYISGTGEEYYIKVFAANINDWQIEIQEQLHGQASPVKITRIQYLGTEKKSYAPPEGTASNENTGGSGYFDYGENGPVCRFKNEPDEYVVITNTGDSWVDISGWTLRNITRGYPTFTFPDHLSSCPPYLDNYFDCGYNCVPLASCMLGPYQSFRVYTDEINPVSGGFTFNYGPGNMWDNDRPETAVLYDSDGNEISRKTYPLFADLPVESPVQISRIYFKGTMSANSAGELSEADEYVVIKNSSGCFQDLSGWRLVNESRESPQFIFPHGFYLCPFETVRIYTNEAHPEWDGLCSTYNAGRLLFDYYDEVHNRNQEKCAFFPVDGVHQGGHLSFNYEKGDIWNNRFTDTAVLYNSLGELMDKKTYTIFPDLIDLFEKK